MTNAVVHPISLENLVFTRCSVIAIPNHKPGNGKIVTPENNIKVSKVPERKGAYTAQMRTLINQTLDQAIPYAVDVECLALLNADDTLTEEEAARGITITAHSVLYGAIRETVAWLTARQPYGPLVLGLSILQTSAAPTPDNPPASPPPSP